MGLDEKLQREKQALRETFKDDPYFQELERFYSEMIQRGLVKKQEYTLPLPDTVGSSFRLQHRSE